MGRPGLHRPAVAASAIVMAIAIYPACKMFGPIGGQLAALVAILASYAFQVNRMRGLTGLNLRTYGKSFLPAILASAAALAIGLLARFAGFAAGPIATIALAAGLCVVAYAACVPAFLKIRQTAKTLAMPNAIV